MIGYVPEDKRAEFRAHYLYSGNASKSARELGIHERTGRHLAFHMSLEPDFIEDRRKLQTQYLDELIAMRQQVANKALKRFNAPNRAEIDKRPDYGKLVLEAEKNAHGIAKIMNPLPDKEQGPAVVINLTKLEKDPEPNALDQS